MSRRHAELRIRSVEQHAADHQAPWSWWLPPNCAEPGAGDDQQPRIRERLFRARWRCMARQSRTARCSLPTWPERAGRARQCSIVIAGDRGMAGGYNANVLQAGEGVIPTARTVSLPIGKQAPATASAARAMTGTERYARVRILAWTTARRIARELCERFRAGDCSTEVCMALHQLCLHDGARQAAACSCCSLPLQRQPTGTRPARADCSYEPDERDGVRRRGAAIRGGPVWCAPCASRLASELAARRTAMDAATQERRRR